MLTAFIARIPLTALTAGISGDFPVLGCKSVYHEVADQAASAFGGIYISPRGSQHLIAALHAQVYYGHDDIITASDRRRKCPLPLLLPVIMVTPIPSEGRGSPKTASPAR